MAGSSVLEEKSGHRGHLKGIINCRRSWNYIACNKGEKCEREKSSGHKINLPQRQQLLSYMLKHHW
jgi:hypothetical protein